MAWILNPCRFNSSISCTSFPLKISAPPPSRVDAGLIPCQGGDFYSGAMGILRPAVTLRNDPDRQDGIHRSSFTAIGNLPWARTGHRRPVSSRLIDIEHNSLHF